MVPPRDLAEAVLLDLAWVHLTGSHRPGIQTHTFLRACEYVVMARPTLYEVIPAYREVVEASAIVRAARALEAKGYRYDPYYPPATESQYIRLENPKPGRGRRKSRCVYPDGSTH